MEGGHGATGLERLLPPAGTDKLGYIGRAKLVGLEKIPLRISAEVVPPCGWPINQHHVGAMRCWEDSSAETAFLMERQLVLLNTREVTPRGEGGEWPEIDGFRADMFDKARKSSVRANHQLGSNRLRLPAWASYSDAANHPVLNDWAVAGRALPDIHARIPCRIQKKMVKEKSARTAVGVSHIVGITMKVQETILHINQRNRTQQADSLNINFHSLKVRR